MYPTFSFTAGFGVVVITVFHLFRVVNLPCSHSCLLYWLSIDLPNSFQLFVAALGLLGICLWPDRPFLEYLPQGCSQHVPPSLWRHSEYGVFSPQDDSAYEMVTASQMRLWWHCIARPVSWSFLKKMASNSLLYVLLDLHQSCCASCIVSCTSVLTKRVGPGDIPSAISSEYWRRFIFSCFHIPVPFSGEQETSATFCALPCVSSSSSLEGLRSLKTIKELLGSAT